MCNGIIFHFEESVYGGYETGVSGNSIYTKMETIGELKKSLRTLLDAAFMEQNWFHMVKEKPRFLMRLNET